MRAYLAAVGLVWMAACIGAYLFAHQQHIPEALVWAVLPALLLELALYVASGFPAARKPFEWFLPRPLKPVLLAAGAIAPWLWLSWRLGTFTWTHFALLLATICILAFWYAFLRPRLLSDLAFLAVAAAVFLSPLLLITYGAYAPRLHLEALGRLMWIRLGIMAVLSLRRMDEAHFGFVPSRKEWITGIQHFLYFAPIGAALAYFLHFARWRPLPLVWWKFPLFAVATFLAMLWVVALAEEFFFRGFLQQLLARAAHSRVFGLVFASVLFGLAHLPFRHFPNWRFAIVAAVAGLFYGLAFLRARSVRASMVTHALVATTWRVFFLAT